MADLITSVDGDVVGEWTLKYGDLVYLYPPDKDLDREVVGRYVGIREAEGFRIVHFEIPDGTIVPGFDCFWIPLWAAEKLKVGRTE